MLPRVFMKEEPGFFFFLLEAQRCVSVVVLFWIRPCWAKKSYFMLRNSPQNLFLISLLLPTELYFLPDLSAQHNKPLLENMDIDTLHNVFFSKSQTDSRAHLWCWRGFACITKCCNIVFSSQFFWCCLLLSRWPALDSQNWAASRGSASTILSMLWLWPMVMSVGSSLEILDYTVHLLGDQSWIIALR